jgi:hypothetical protein
VVTTQAVTTQQTYIYTEPQYQYQYTEQQTEAPQTEAPYYEYTEAPEDNGFANYDDYTEDTTEEQTEDYGY